MVQYMVVKTTRVEREETLQDMNVKTTHEVPQDIDVLKTSPRM